MIFIERDLCVLCHSAKFTICVYFMDVCNINCALYVGFGQLFCSDMTDCSTTINQTADVVTCCLRSDSIAYATGSSGEGCVSCYG